MEQKDYEGPLKRLSFEQIEGIIGKALSEALGEEIACEVSQIQLAKEAVPHGQSELMANVQLKFFVQGAQVSYLHRMLIESESRKAARSGDSQIDDDEDNLPAF